MNFPSNRGVVFGFRDARGQQCRRCEVHLKRGRGRRFGFGNGGGFDHHRLQGHGQPLQIGGGKVLAAGVGGKAGHLLALFLGQTKAHHMGGEINARRL